MSSSVNVHSVEAVDNLRSAYSRFQTEAQETLQAAEQEVRRTEGWLQERLAYRRAEVQRLQEELRLVTAALARCEASGYRDPKTGNYYKPPCIAEQQAVQRTKAQLQEAQQRLNDVQTGIRLVGQAASSYRAQAQRTNRLLSTNFPGALSFLTGKIADLQAYLAGGSSSASTSTSVSSSTSPSGGNGTVSHQGINEVPLDQIDLSDSYVRGAGDFKKVSPQTMREGFQKLQDVVIPAVAKGADADYFARLDASQGLDNASGYLHIYHVFYGDNCIRLDKVGNKYTVTNGYHRLFIARQLGITSVPARVFPAT